MRVKVGTKARARGDRHLDYPVVLLQMAQLEGQTLMIEPKYCGRPASMPEAQAEVSKDLQTGRAQGYDGAGRSIRENNCVVTSSGRHGFRDPDRTKMSAG